MKISIITINYNNAEGLRKTIASVAAQTYRDIEHIIVDAASTDGSVSVIKEYAEKADYPVLWSSKKDNGVYNGMNIGILRSTGGYIQILNSGDVLAAPAVTERMISELDSLNAKRSSLNEDSVAILYGNMLKSYDGKKIIRDTCGSGMYTPESFLYFYISMKRFKLRRFR